MRATRLRKSAVRDSSLAPLAGVRVVVGRASHQAGALSTELRRLGASVIEIPFIEIRKPQSFKPLDDALKNLSAYDWLVLTSVNGVEAMWERMKKFGLTGLVKKQSGVDQPGEATHIAGAVAPVLPRIAAIGPATKKAIEQRGMKVDVMPKEYIAESVVRSLKSKVRGKRVLLVRARIARDVIPRDLRRAGAHVDVIEAYETVAPKSSRARLQGALNDPKSRPHVITFTSSSTVKNFAELLGGRKASARILEGIQMASIGPVTSATLRELGLPVDIEAREFTTLGLVEAICRTVANPATR